MLVRHVTNQREMIKAQKDYESLYAARNINMSEENKHFKNQIIYI